MGESEGVGSKVKRRIYRDRIQKKRSVKQQARAAQFGAFLVIMGGNGGLQ